MSKPTSSDNYTAATLCSYHNCGGTREQHDGNIIRYHYFQPPKATEVMLDDLQTSIALTMGIPESIPGNDGTETRVSAQLKADAARRAL